MGRHFTYTGRGSFFPFFWVPLIRFGMYRVVFVFQAFPATEIVGYLHFGGLSLVHSFALPLGDTSSDC